jgi:dephospho-CoA kinase
VGGTMDRSEKLYLGISGRILSGKSSAANFFVSKFKADHLRFSKVLDEILEILDLQKTRVNEQDLGALVKELFGEEVLSRALKVRGQNSQHSVVLFDGLRKKEEVLALKELPNFKFIFIKASPEIRYQRMLQRNEKVGESQQSFEDFLASESHAADKNISGLENLADFVIVNEGTADEFEAQLTKLLSLEI